MNNYYNENAHTQEEYRDQHADAKHVCQRYMNYHVIGNVSNGTQMEGIITDMDDEGVTMLVPEDVDEDVRQFGGYGGYGRRRFRRFRRRRFPFYFFVYPFFTPYPYYYPYPYQPYSY
jgi:hypothetical protein